MGGAAGVLGLRASEATQDRARIPASVPVAATGPSAARVTARHDETSIPLGPSAVFVGTHHPAGSVASLTVTAEADQPFELSVIDPSEPGAPVVTAGSRRVGPETHRAQVRCAPGARSVAVRVVNGRREMRALSVESEGVR